jgi:uncharacterized protein YozE (UPF0346 family)
MKNRLISRRYYLHGDLYELNPNKYYCALCDAFELKEHFYSNDFHKNNNQEKYIRSLARYKKANERFLIANSRPKSAKNLFSDITKKKAGRFYHWLKKQKERDDPIGDLANDALRDKSFPMETNSSKVIKNYLLFKEACDEAIQALAEAYEEFKTKIKYRSGISPKIRFEIFKRDNYKCQVCGASVKEDGVKLEVDHKNPKSMGGTDDESNLWTLCFDCNRGKGKCEL